MSDELTTCSTYYNVNLVLKGLGKAPMGGEPSVPTNVTRITRALKSYTKKDGISQIVYYQSGVGTGGTLNKLIGGEFINIHIGIRYSLCYPLPATHILSTPTQA